MIKAQPAAVVEGFPRARHELEVLITWLTAPTAADLPHSVVEEHIQTEGLAVLRALDQGHLDRRAAADRRAAEARAARAGAAVTCATRVIESLFGTVTLARCAGPAATAGAPDFPLDRALNLPAEQDSLPVRQRVAEHARQVSMAQTVAAVDRTTGAHVPKRQVEALVGRAAQDFDAFYAQRPAPANDTASAAALRVLTCDSKGIAMVPAALRDATRKTAAAARAAQAAHRDPMAPRKRRKHDKRMALVSAVYLQEPCVRTAAEIAGDLAGTRPAGPRAARPRPQQKTVAASVIASQKAGIAALFDEAARRDPTHARTTVVLVDGEERQKARITHEARARRWTLTVIVDLIHVLSYVWKAATALSPDDRPATERCVTAALRSLLGGEARALASRLRRLANQQGLSGDARKPIDRCVGYLRKNAQHLRYDVYLAAGYPIATGVIEGACRHLVEDRMGITGARWDLPGAEAVLRLRALAIHGDWDAYWAFHERQHAARLAEKRAA